MIQFDSGKTRKGWFFIMKKNKVFLLLAMALTFVLVLAGCATSGGGTPEGPAAEDGSQGFAEETGGPGIPEDPARSGMSAYMVSTLAGSTRDYADGTGTAAKFSVPNGVAVDSAGNVYVADTQNHRIRKITPAGVVTTFAGSDRGYADGTGAAAKFAEPDGMAVDSTGNVYVADNSNSRIRKITPEGVVTTIAGSDRGYAEGAGVAAKFFWPHDVAVDGAGNIYVADSGNHRIRKITPAGIVTSFAGSTEGYADGTGAAAKFAGPQSVAVDSADNVYVADTFNHRIRKITPEGVVITLAGSGDTGRDNGGNADGTAQDAQFAHPRGIAVDSAGSVYVADAQNLRIRKITPEGEVTTIAGSTGGNADGTGAEAQFHTPNDVAVDSEGNVYVADRGGDRIRKITITTP
jgi:sugar lactone lactonase YvrE